MKARRRVTAEKTSVQVVTETLDELAEALRAKGVTLEELLKGSLDIREQLASQKYNLNASTSAKTRPNDAGS